MILGSDSEERTVIISSRPDLSHGVNQGLLEDVPYHLIERLMKSPYSLTSSDPSHVSETPSRSTIQKTPLYSLSHLVDCDIFGNGLCILVLSAGTPDTVQPRALSFGSGIKSQGDGKSSASAVISIYESLLSLQSH